MLKNLGELSDLNYLADDKGMHSCTTGVLAVCYPLMIHMNERICTIVHKSSETIVCSRIVEPPFLQ